MNIDEKIDIDKPLWDQSTYIGRLKHFAFITDFRMIFESKKRLREAKQFCDDYKMGKIPSGTQMSDIIRAKQLRDGAFHPDTGELIHSFSRLSFQMPASAVLTASMLAFQKNTPVTVTLQILHQLHIAIINYTYRSRLNNNDKTTIRNTILCAAITSSIVTVYCKKILFRRFILQRYLPFCAMTTSHILNLPIIRYKEITTGIPLFMKDEKNPFMKSKVAAIKGVYECLITRIVMSIPCLIFVPLLTHKFLANYFFQRRSWILIPIETCLCALGCLFAIPSALAIFPERNSMSTELMKLYPSEYEDFKKCVKEHVDKVYYNKGL
ncbi:Sideroflexin-3 [Eufriesea mexicana]|uniref:Sideroflexin-3 n=1 Tax=Eufriesea mexicana TaxID=516756 RepID=A0A310SLG4_9HYME|nr:PREDICTED: sideroflexin-2-like [Eufriesea mexicana]OAD57932.1 Sideroflexin-3 [Eufriesea mexicana]